MVPINSFLLSQIITVIFILRDKLFSRRILCTSKFCARKVYKLFENAKYILAEYFNLRTWKLVNISNFHFHFIFILFSLAKMQTTAKDFTDHVQSYLHWLEYSTRPGCNMPSKLRSANLMLVVASAKFHSFEFRWDELREPICLVADKSDEIFALARKYPSQLSPQQDQDNRKEMHWRFAHHASASGPCFYTLSHNWPSFHDRFHTTTSVWCKPSDDVVRLTRQVFTHFLTFSDKNREMLKASIPYQIGVHLAHVCILMQSWTIDSDLWSLFWSLVDFFDASIAKPSPKTLVSSTALTLNSEDSKSTAIGSDKPYRSLFLQSSKIRHFKYYS